MASARPSRTQRVLTWVVLLLGIAIGLGGIDMLEAGAIPVGAITFALGFGLTYLALRRVQRTRDADQAQESSPD